nr:hypothetical protein [uncultured Psychroserpens sp.]
MNDLKLKTIILECTKVFLLFLIVATNLSCKNHETSTELEKHFTDTQIKDLNNINDFFISDFLKSDKTNYKEAFIKFIDSLKWKGQFSKNDELLFKKQLTLYSSISQSTFDEIWEVKTVQVEQFKGEKYITSKYQGKFMSFLNDVKSENTFLEQSYDNLEKIGSYQASFIDGYFYYNRDSFDYNNFHNQITLSIVYMTALDDNERDLDRKTRNEKFRNENKFLMDE